MPQKILITGASGYIGQALTDRLGQDRVLALFNQTAVTGGIHFDALTMRLHDVIDNWSDISFGVVLHAEADPNASACDRERSHALNVTSCMAAIDCLIDRGITPVFASSEAVFGQDAEAPYDENDQPQPCFLYGHQKLAVENYLRAATDDHLIVRVARVVGSEYHDPTGFEEWVGAMALDGDILCADDQVMSPICRNDAVEGLTRLMESDCRGTYHLPGERAINRLDLLKAMIAAVEHVRSVNVNIRTCGLHDFPLTEQRPLNTAMSSTCLTADTGFSATPYEEICRKMAASFPTNSKRDKLS